MRFSTQLLDHGRPPAEPIMQHALTFLVCSTLRLKTDGHAQAVVPVAIAKMSTIDRNLAMFQAL